MNATLSLATAIDSTDCDWPQCSREAERDGRCRYHVGRVPLAPPPGGAMKRDWTPSDRPAHIAHDGSVIAGSLAYLMDEDPDDHLLVGETQPPQKEPTVPDLVLCRVDGCSRASVAQKGPWKGWCAEHKAVEMKRRAAVRRATMAAGSSSVKPPPVPEAAATQPPPVAEDNPAHRLSEILPLIAAKREELLELQAEAVGLVMDINDLLDAA